MQMLNRAIEDASDFRDMLRKGENREQHRARLRQEAKAAKTR